MELASLGRRNRGTGRIRPGLDLGSGDRGVSEGLGAAPAGAPDKEEEEGEDESDEGGAADCDADFCAGVEGRGGGGCEGVAESEELVGDDFGGGV